MTKAAPGYSMVILDPDNQHGHTLIEFIGYRSPRDKRPHIELDAAKDRQWFDYYITQFNEIWNTATPYAFEGSD